jgi:tRNA (adenine22-N1)-methyltransferase
VSRPRLPERLRRLADLVPPDGAVADIGAGHGLLAAHLATSGRHVIATELGPGPLTELRGNLESWGLAGAVEVREGRGLEPLRDGEVAAAVIAGMGAHTIVDAAGLAAERGLRWLVVQAMQHQRVLEEWLSARGWPVRARVLARQAGRDYEGLLVEVAA